MPTFGNAGVATLLFALVAVVATPVLAGGPATLCTNLPRVGWVSAEEVEGHLRREGYQLLRLRVSNEACFIALVANGRGQQLELRVHPANGALLGPADLPLQLPAR